MVTDPPPTGSTIVPGPRKKLDSEFNDEENKLEMADTRAEETSTSELLLMTSSRGRLLGSHKWTQTKKLRSLEGSYSKVNSGSAGVNTGNTPVSTPSVVQTVNVTIPSPVKVQREGKAPMTTEDDEEATRQVHLDALLAKRIQEEQELSEQQQKIKAQVHEAAQHYTEDD
ncbi:hypothetical protein Tco_0125229 [Tanacetum coccineum]